jgi:hypothetical protein
MSDGRVTDEKIGLSMPQADYLQALVLEMGNPTLLVTQAALLKKLQEAAVRVQFKAQEATQQVM